MTKCDICNETFDEQEIIIREIQISEKEKSLVFVCKDCLPSKEKEI